MKQTAGQNISSGIAPTEQSLPTNIATIHNLKLVLGPSPHPFLATPLGMQQQFPKIQYFTVELCHQFTLQRNHNNYVKVTLFFLHMTFHLGKYHRRSILLLLFICYARDWMVIRWILTQYIPIRESNGLWWGRLPLIKFFIAVSLNDVKNNNLSCKGLGHPHTSVIISLRWMLFVWKPLQYCCSDNHIFKS